MDNKPYDPAADDDSFTLGLTIPLDARNGGYQPDFTIDAFMDGPYQRDGVTGKIFRPLTQINGSS